MRSVSLMLTLTLLFLSKAIAADEAYQSVQPLLETGETILGETITYPPGKAEITAVIVTIQPGEETRLHKHGVPLFAYILSGEATVDYGDKGTKVYPAGTAFMEAMDQWHHGMNNGKEPVRILAVYLGSDHGKNVVLKK
jgi:quercetin dioxygenase-like cupin family protein